ncbi:pectinesterase family protein [Nonomuraea sp. NPDC051941]|uniref:pectinesterase family protein n=1 Tax=Nonomuraea sp. NPDC051941 TaxID=3364373 RepID=UPI0037C890DB
MTAAPAPAAIVVAADGSGDHTTVQAAVDAVPAGNTRPVTILVRKGTYRQQVVIPADKPHISLVGATRDPREVVLTFDASAAAQKPDGSGPYGTSGSASCTISAPDFTARNLTFENAYDGAEGGSGAATFSPPWPPGPRLVSKTWTGRTHSASSCGPAASCSSRRRPACRSRPGAAWRGCAARRSPGSRA